MALVCGRVSTQKVKVALIVHIPDKHTLSLVQDDRNGSIVVGTVLVFSFNELQGNRYCHPRRHITGSNAGTSAYALLPRRGCLSIDRIMPAARRSQRSLADLLAYIRAAETTCSNCRTPPHLEGADLVPQGRDSTHCPQQAL